MLHTIYFRTVIYFASSRRNDIQEQQQNDNLLISFIKQNQGSYFASNGGSQAFLIQQVNPVI